MDWNRIKIKENKPTSDPLSPRFSLTFPMPDAKSVVGQEILTRVKGSADMLIELNANLMYAKNVDLTSSFDEFLELMRALLIPVHENVVQTTRTTGLFDFITKTKRNTRLVYAIVTDAQWQDERVRNALPLSGVKYYVMRDPADADAEKVFSRMYMISDEQKLDVFEFILFDMSDIGQIGLNTRHLTLQELQQRIG